MLKRLIVLINVPQPLYINPYIHLLVVEFVTVTNPMKDQVINPGGVVGAPN